MIDGPLTKDEIDKLHELSDEVLQWSEIVRIKGAQPTPSEMGRRLKETAEYHQMHVNLLIVQRKLEQYKRFLSEKYAAG